MVTGSSTAPDLRLLVYERATHRDQEWTHNVLWRLMHDLSWDGGCWIWMGHVHSSGYGSLGAVVNGRKVSTTHRIAYELFRGPVGNKWVLHACDNRRCCNPDHLSLGTLLDNARDAMERGSHRRPYWKAVQHEI